MSPSLHAGIWYAPTVTGDVPPPCDGFSLLNIDEYHAVFFGEYMEGQECSSDVYYLDLRMWVSDSGTHDRSLCIALVSDSGTHDRLLCIALAIAVWILPVLKYAPWSLSFMASNIRPRCDGFQSLYV